MFYIHIPADYNQITYLIDELDDLKKKAAFFKAKIKQIQIDQGEGELGLHTSD